MAIIATNAVHIARFANALYATQLGSVTNAQVQSDITATGGLDNALNAYYAYSFGGLTTAKVTSSMLTNLGLVAGKNGLTQAAVDNASLYIVGVLNAAAPNARGAAVKALLNQWANISDDANLGATYGAAAAVWNGQVTTAQVYTGTNTNDAPVGAVVSGQTFNLTQGLDTFTGGTAADTFNAYAFNSVTGSDTTTLHSVDALDGGDGTDTLNIEVKASGAAPDDFNNAIQGAIKNIEIININNSAAATPSAVDASALGAEAQQIWQQAQHGNVTKLAATTTAGYKNIAAGAAIDVTPADAAATATVAFDKVGEGSTLNVLATGTGTLNSVKVSGTVVDAGALDGVVANTIVAVTVGKDVQSLALNTTAATDLRISDGAGTKKLATIDASASTGAIKYNDGETTVTTITTGSGKDDVTVVTVTAKDVLATAADETVNATVTTNDGDDKVTVNVTGDGKTTVSTGAGNDTVSITARATSVLTVNLGDGSDSFTSATPIAATDTIDAGDGSDTLLLSLVGSSNVAAFKNFDVYDVKAMAANLDLDILNTQNTVAEIVASGALGGAVSLLNVGAGVNFRATKDMDPNALTLTQKTAGAQTITLDVDQATEANGNEAVDMSVVAENATAVTATFDAAYANVAGTQAGEVAANDNISTITLSTKAATTLAVVSGGANAKNVLNVSDDATGDALTAVTVTGAQALTLSVATATKLASVDASAATGGLTASLADLKNGGMIKLGSGTDVITATAASNTAGAESITGFAKTAAVSVSSAAADATAKAAAIAAADKLTVDVDGVTDEAVANASVSLLAATLSNGVLTFTGAGPATLAAALVIADDFAETIGETVAFQYLGDTYVYAQGATHVAGATAVTAADVLVKLTGVTGVANLSETGTDTFFVV